MGPTGTSILSLVIPSAFCAASGGALPLFLHKCQSTGGSLGTANGIFLTPNLFACQPVRGLGSCTSLKVFPKVPK